VGTGIAGVGGTAETGTLDVGAWIFPPQGQVPVLPAKESATQKRFWHCGQLNSIMTETFPYHWWYMSIENRQPKKAPRKECPNPMPVTTGWANP